MLRNANTTEIISARCQYYLKKSNMSIYALAKKMDMPYANVYRLVHGKNSPSTKSLERLANAFGVTVAELTSPLDPEKENEA